MTRVLINQGYNVDIISTYSKGPFKSSKLTIHRCRTSRLLYRNIVGQIVFLLEASQIVHKIAPDIVHTRDYLPSSVLLSRGSPCPVVVTVPGNIFTRIKEGHNYDWTVVRTLRWAARVSARHCSAVIATSFGMQESWLATGVSNNRLATIPLGVDTERFYFVPDARAELGLPEKTPLLLYVGRYSPEKGLDELLQAINALKHLFRRKKARLILLGDGPLRPELNSVIGENSLQDIVHLHGKVHQDELKLWYSAADVLLLPSRNEPFGKVFVEAMACGTPTIASATEGPRDHLQHEHNGFLFLPGDSNALAEQIRLILTNPERLRKMKTPCINYVEDNLTWKAVTKSIIEHVYKPLLAGESIRQPPRSGSSVTNTHV